MRFSSLRDKVVVITGASSGIGKLAVEEFLKRGAKVVLAARNLDAMQEHLMLLGVADDRALALPVDVSNFDDMQRLADQARAHFDKIDVWINNAGISVYGKLEHLEPEEISRVIDVNLKGQMYGSLLAIRTFKEQRYGNLINVSSVLGRSSAPIQSAYVASKHGIVGFTSTIREELDHDIDQYGEIGVSTVMPASMDTPLFLHAKCKEGVEPYPIPPVYDPILTVKALIRCAMNPKPEVTVGGAGKLLNFGFRLFPRATEKYMGKTAVRQQLTDIPEPSGDESNNLFHPMPGTQDIRGGIGTTRQHLMEEVGKRPVQVGLAVAIPALLLTFMIRRRAAAV